MQLQAPEPGPAAAPSLLTCPREALTGPKTKARQTPHCQGAWAHRQHICAGHCSWGHNIQDALKAFSGHLSRWTKAQDRPEVQGASAAGRSVVSISALGPSPVSKALCLSAGAHLHSGSRLQDTHSCLFLPPQSSLGSGLAGVTDAAETQHCRGRAVHTVPRPLSHTDPAPACISPGCLQLGLAPSTQETEKPHSYLPAHPEPGSEQDQRSQQGGSVYSQATGI